MLLAKIVVCTKNYPKSSWNTWWSTKCKCSLSKLQQIVVKLCSSATCSLSLPNTGSNCRRRYEGILQYLKKPIWIWLPNFPLDVGVSLYVILSAQHYFFNSWTIWCSCFFNESAEYKIKPLWLSYLVIENGELCWITSRVSFGAKQRLKMWTPTVSRWVFLLTLTAVMLSFQGTSDTDPYKNHTIIIMCFSMRMNDIDMIISFYIVNHIAIATCVKIIPIMFIFFQNQSGRIIYLCQW